MANEPIQNGDIEALKEENAVLREKLARRTIEADLYRRAAYEMLDELDPETPPTDQEIEELLNSPHEQHLLEIIEEYERMVEE
ncbi:MAG TPA: hypothetical protein VGL71_14115 [Urbifossiella sp.]|jgi:hypothetical protein